jgi:oligopeptide transport system ATP-binding protein
VIGGLPPALMAIPPGCPFNPRCSYARDVCREGPPPELAAVPDPGHAAACLFWEEVRG